MSHTNILIVEDESIVALDIKNRLQKSGYAVAGMVSSGEKAIRAAGKLGPDIVLMDIKLKGKMDGVEAAEQIKAKFDIPVIFLTAFADELTLQRAKVTESFGYLLKPFEERTLTATVETALYKHKIERKLKQNEQWLSTTLNSIGDAVIATDTQGLINFMNPVAEDLTGWQQEDALSKPSSEIFRIINEDTRQPLDNPVALVLKHGKSIKLQRHTLLLAKNGKKIPIDDSAAPIVEKTGRINGVVLVFRDITEQRRAEDKLLKYAAELKQHNEELDAFAHTAAHDLQNPLGHMVSLADALHTYHNSIPPHEMNESLARIVQNGLKMSSIIDSLLLLAGVRRRKTIEIQPLKMDEIIAEVRHRLLFMIEEERVSIELPDVWPVALGYAPWVEEMWINYFVNGIKYGGHPPKLHLGAEPAGKGMILFWVQDNGDGLTPEAKHQLFTPFTKLNQIGTKGHGLGLSIVRRIAKKLNGTVGVESNGLPGHGCRFYFTLPAAPVSKTPE